MDNYYTVIALLGLRDQNLPPMKDARVDRYRSVKKMVDLLDTVRLTCPRIPVEAFRLDPFDPEWDDDMTYPTIEYNKILWQFSAIGLNCFLYAYNYNVITSNIRFRLFRTLFPVVNTVLFGSVYFTYKTQLTKVNLFDEYVQLRAKELVAQNEYLFQHEDFKRFIWWFEDLKETLYRVHREANNHNSADFAESELILQDFIRRYTNPNSERPLDIRNRAVLF